MPGQGHHTVGIILCPLVLWSHLTPSTCRHRNSKSKSFFSVSHPFPFSAPMCSKSPSKHCPYSYLCFSLSQSFSSCLSPIAPAKPLQRPLETCTLSVIGPQCLLPRAPGHSLLRYPLRGFLPPKTVFSSPLLLSPSLPSCGGWQLHLACACLPLSLGFPISRIRGLFPGRHSRLTTSKLNSSSFPKSSPPSISPSHARATPSFHELAWGGARGGPVAGPWTRMLKALDSIPSTVQTKTNKKSNLTHSL